MIRELTRAELTRLGRGHRGECPFCGQGAFLPGERDGEWYCANAACGAGFDVVGASGFGFISGTLIREPKIPA